MKLNDRLAAVAAMVEKNQTIIDVGCDHAFLDIFLVENHIVKKAVASDNKEGPLVQAQKNIKASGLEGNIIVQQADGIQKLDADVDTLIISGMGGRNMIGICKYLPEQMKQIKTIILSPNNEVEQVRKEFAHFGYVIDSESLVKDHGVIYPVIRFKKGKQHYSKAEYILGPILRKDKSSLFNELNEREIKQKEMLISVMPPKYWWRKWQLKQEVHLRKKVQKR